MGTAVRNMILFLVRPFIRFVGYLALKMMKRGWRPDDDQPPRAAASHIAETMAIEPGFSVFHNRTFRDVVKFDALSTTERDRMFNELVTAGMCLTLLCLDFADALVPPEAYHFWRGVRKLAPEEFESHLVGHGIAPSHAAGFRKLIGMRYEEYEELTREVEKVWDVEEPQFQSLPTVAAKRSVARVHAIAIGATDHIRRGKMKPRDPLVDFLRSWLLELNEDIGRFIRDL
ncbi:MAG: hypothetical protein Q7S84_00380 [bacterium]|nr:hypothetical protein [bacterium]